MEQIDISPAHGQLIGKAMAQAFPGQTWTLLSQVGGGLSTSLIYKVAIDGKPYVARLSDPANPLNNLAREYDAMALAANQNLGPRLYHANPDTGIALMDFVESQPWRGGEANAAEMMRQMAHLIRTMHGGAAFQQDNPLTAKVEDLWRQMRSDLAEHPLVQRNMAQLRQLAPMLNDPADARPCHCDINPGNVLYDGQRLWLVDWAAAAQESFYFDLACCCNFFYQSPEAEAAFLRAYFERPLTPPEEAKYARMNTFVAIYYGLIFLFLSSHSGIALLSASAIDALPTQRQFWQRIGQGQESLSDPLSQQRLGFVYLQKAARALS